MYEFLDFIFSSMVPTRTGKPGKMGGHFPVREKSENFEQKNQGILPKILEFLTVENLNKY